MFTPGGAFTGMSGSGGFGGMDNMSNVGNFGGRDMGPVGRMGGKWAYLLILGYDTVNIYVPLCYL